MLVISVIFSLRSLSVSDLLILNRSQEEEEEWSQETDAGHDAEKGELVCVLEDECGEKRANELTWHEKGPEDTIVSALVLVIGDSGNIPTLGYPENRSAKTVDDRRYEDNSLDSVLTETEVGVLCTSRGQDETRRVEGVAKGASGHGKALATLINDWSGDKAAQSEWEVEESKRVSSQITETKIVEYLWCQVLSRVEDAEEEREAER